jgi:aryl-alcohol dehydrogenase-like predicted oxidoreductase
MFDISQDGSSEKFIGEWAEQRGIRDQLFIATKVNKLPYFPTRSTNAWLYLVFFKLL